MSDVESLLGSFKNISDMLIKAEFMSARYLKLLTCSALFAVGGDGVRPNEECVWCVDDPPRDVSIMSNTES